MVARDAVEVKADPSINAWYKACLVDITKSGFVLSFEDDVWPEQEFPAEDVRFGQRECEAKEIEDFTPAVGELAEFEVKMTATSPSGWRLCRVRSRQGSFFLVSPTERNASGSRAEVIVPRSRLRSHVPSRNSIEGYVTKTEVPVDRQLTDWLMTPQAATSFSRVEFMAAATQESSAPEDDSVPGRLRVRLAQPGEEKVYLIGTDTAVQRAKVLMPAVIQHQLQVKIFEEACRMRKEALDDRQARVEGKPKPSKKQIYAEEFVADAAVAREIAGPSGANLKALERELPNVVVKLVPNRGDPEKMTFRVTGSTEAAVKEAIETLQIVEVTIDVDNEMISWVLGREQQTLSRFSDAAGLQGCELHEDRRQIVCKGSRQACDKASELFRAHMLYFDTFREMDKRMEVLHTDLKDRVKEARKGKGKGKGKGKEKREPSPWGRPGS
eukprot:gnl/TRDRNA2_/TRDRNA2_64730_c0_seq1.p1 gnl/TRDRNA2_/TRDRNA2_64730_c0~~gnl/TRDRNA2_/TRDRNA2_64730_c0_seq1.p1  ORF type:complete len:466 (+),score=103.20 gnl/TRDRNA2_/TRDRNA2_64730_c0_seq1:76-1398(+)